MAELRKMVEKRVWHGVRVIDLAFSERAAIIRSSMSTKDKFTASVEFEKFKARLVAVGDEQEKVFFTITCPLPPDPPPRCSLSHPSQCLKGNPVP